MNWRWFAYSKRGCVCLVFFFFNDTATTEIYTLSLHDALPIIPGALQVFSGALLTRWSNGRLRPGRHRVVAGGTVTRRSTAVFCYPSLDTVVGPLAPFVGPEGATEEPVLVWDHVKTRAEDYLEEFGRPDQVTAWREG